MVLTIEEPISENLGDTNLASTNEVGSQGKNRNNTVRRPFGSRSNSKIIILPNSNFSNKFEESSGNVESHEDDNLDENLSHPGFQRYSSVSTPENNEMGQSVLKPIIEPDLRQDEVHEIVSESAHMKYIFKKNTNKGLTN